MFAASPNLRSGALKILVAEHSSVAPIIARYLKEAGYAYASVIVAISDEGGKSLLESHKGNIRLVIAGQKGGALTLDATPSHIPSIVLSPSFPEEVHRKPGTRQWQLRKDHTLTREQLLKTVKEALSQR